MEPISFAITIASLASIFQTCVNGYASLNVALAMGDTAVGLNLRFRIEEMRLRLWGKNRGFSVRDHDGHRQITPETLGKPIRDRNNDILQIPQMKRLVEELLGRIVLVLEKHKRVINKYDALKSPKYVESEDDNSSSLPLFSEVTQAMVGQKDRAKDTSKRTHFGAKLRWALKDKQALDDLLDELTALNDGLECLLPRGDALSLSQSLVGEVISSGKDLPAVTDQSFGAMGRKAATVIELRQYNMTNLSETSSPFSTTTFNIMDGQFDPLIPTTCFRDFTEPRLKYIQTSKDFLQQETSLEAPPERSVHFYTPATGMDGRGLEPSIHEEGEFVLIEWRSQKAESRYSKISPEELAERRKHLVSLLHRTSTVGSDFRVLNCLGFTLATGRLPDGKTHDLVGFVYRMPAYAATEMPPVSLREILGAAYRSEESKIPDLDDRYILAQNLSVALYQLHCAGWIHRKISSYNIVFFKDEINGEVDLKQPYLCGWQYARPDFRTAGYKHIIGDSEHSRGDSIGDLNMYVHPDRLNIEKGFPRFRRSFDIYSLGIILIEIAFWEPIVSFAIQVERTKMEKFEVYESPSQATWAATIVEAAEKELGSEMGVAYRRAVLACLRGMEASNRENGVVEEDDLKSLEPGIESEFFWKVVTELKRD